MSHTRLREFSDEEHEANAHTMPEKPNHKRIILDKINRVELLLRTEWGEMEPGQCPLYTQYLSNPNL